jgi:hypothetical protein
MHKTNELFWKTCSKKYSKHFSDPSEVIEFGSYNINGSIREAFSCSKYTGLDWRPGPCVDAVSLAHSYRHPNKVDTVVSASMLEHDPYWPLSLSNMINNHMTDQAILILTWGAARNAPHCRNEAPDGGFHCLKAETVCKFLKLQGLYIHEFRYEGNLPYFVQDVGDGFGEVGIVAFRSKEYASGDRSIDEFMPEDCI